MEVCHGDEAAPASMQDLRSYSINYPCFTQPNQLSKEVKIKKGRSNSGLSSKGWSFCDPELQRKTRLLATMSMP
uniref:Eukaryotic initiation factor 4A-1 n=1 Tax=Rhizophora mucronata TaxID=61149 RepID=A0A2P2IL16_RHIMU